MSPRFPSASFMFEKLDSDLTTLLEQEMTYVYPKKLVAVLSHFLVFFKVLCWGVNNNLVVWFSRANYFPAALAACCLDYDAWLIFV